MEVTYKRKIKSREVDGMIKEQELRLLARTRNLSLDIVEKDYAIGWILVGLSSSSLSNKLIFKGGTALSKIYFPSNWRISEDLDFTLLESSTLDEVSKILLDELPDLVLKKSGDMSLNFTEKPFTNPGFLRVRVQYTGPITKNTVKIEITKEKFIGDYKKTQPLQQFDYPAFTTLTYTLNNILAEKLRAIIQRGHIRDYYDSWMLLKRKVIDFERVKELFLKKCRAKGITFKSTSDFFPNNIEKTLEPYLKTGLTRMSSKPLPPIAQIINELRLSIVQIF